ncbi:MAG: BON domain-containing protein [Planctomycetaceae bacterium]|nr:BON domain-containing protein [Planctomycetaceae bacterium]
MKRYIFTFLFLFSLFSASFAFAQMPSVEMPSLFSAGGEQTSISDIIKRAMAAPQMNVVTENTAENVKSAIIEGPLVVEEIIPETNQEIVEAIDPKTKRYPPRIQLNFKEFPLIKIENTIKNTANNTVQKNTVQKAGEPETFAVTNLHRADLISNRIRLRTKQNGINIDFKDRTAILTGTVETQRQIELAEIMLRFEPGVDKIENKLTLR